MIVGLGTDISDIQRIRHIHAKFGRHFLDKILTRNEFLYLPASPAAFLAGRWAAKEAAAKALGTGFNHGLGMRDIEIIPLSSGKPYLRFHARAAVAARLLGAKNHYISISHDRLYAIATVILEG